MCLALQHAFIQQIDTDHLAINRADDAEW